MSQRIEYHIHSFHSDGVMLPGEVISKAASLNYKALAITDHADESNLEELLNNFKTFLKITPQENLKVLTGVELSYVFPEDLINTATKARELGAQIIIVHGETPTEPYNEGINDAAVDAPEGLIDIIAHPGFITAEQAQKAAQKNIYLELTTRKGHCLTNGHIAKIAKQNGAKMLINTNAHTIGDLITQEEAMTVAKGAGLENEDILLVTEVYPEELLNKALNIR
ncbi:MAG: histidinol phosphate phosphatase domain-containing protein [Vampirovibrionia bacterium]